MAGPHSLGWARLETLSQFLNVSQPADLRVSGASPAGAVGTKEALATQAGTVIGAPALSLLRLRHVLAAPEGLGPHISSSLYSLPQHRWELKNGTFKH